MTTPERYERLRRLFAKVCDLDGSRRRELLDSECEGEPDLRAEVESLLACDENAGAFLRVRRLRGATRLSG